MTPLGTTLGTREIRMVHNTDGDKIDKTITEDLTIIIVLGNNYWITITLKKIKETQCNTNLGTGYTLLAVKGFCNVSVSKTCLN